MDKTPLVKGGQSRNSVEITFAANVCLAAVLVLCVVVAWEWLS